MKRTLTSFCVIALIMSAWACVPSPMLTHNASDVLSASHQLMVCDTLYFGLSTPVGEVSESDWGTFVCDVVTPRFPKGFTSWEASGQWRGGGGVIQSERSKVVQLIHHDDSRDEVALREIISKYKSMFDQESVMWVRSSVLVSF
jgi:hypothetical protein